MIAAGLKYLSVVMPGKVKRRLVDGRLLLLAGRRLFVRHCDASQVDVAAFLDNQFDAPENRRFRH